MGRKTNSVSLRLKNTNRDYNHCWYSDILYSYNLSRSWKLDNYLSQTLKTIEMPCPQASIIGAYKKASVLVCYLDPKKRVRLLEKSSGGVHNNASGFFSLREKKQDRGGLLNPQGALDSKIFYQGNRINSDLIRAKVKPLSEKRKAFSFVPTKAMNQGLPLLKQKKPFFFQGQLGLELSKKFLDPATADRYTPLRLTEKKNAVYDCNSFFPAFLKKLYPKNSRNKTQVITLKGSINKNPVSCLDGSYQNIYPLTPDPIAFPYILTFPPKQYSKFKYISEKFYGTGSSMGIDFPVSPKEQATQRLRGCFPEKLFLGPELIVGISKSLSIICALYKNFSIYGSKKGYNTGFSEQKGGLAYRKLVLEKLLLDLPHCAKGAWGTLSPSFLGIEPRKSGILSQSWNSPFFLEKWKGQDNNYCRNAVVSQKKMIVQKNVKNSFLTLYQFYHGFSYFWENVVQISFYKSTNETCCSLFLANTVAFLLEKKVLFRSIKKQLLLELNNRNQSGVLESSLFSKTYVAYVSEEQQQGQEKKKVTGIRICCSGRVGGRSKKAQRSRKDTFMWGETGLHVFSNKLDFAKTHAETPFGTVGVKVWVCTM